MDLFNILNFKYFANIYNNFKLKSNIIKKLINIIEFLLKNIVNLYIIIINE